MSAPDGVVSSGVVVAVAAGYLLACLAIGMWPGRRQSRSAEGFVAGDRSLGLFVMYFITGGTIFSAFSFLGAPGWAYSRGAASYYVLAYGCFGFLPFYFLGPRASRVGKALGFVTQAEMVAARFRMPLLAGVMALVSAIAFVPYLAIQMKGAGYVLSAMTRGTVSESAGAAIVYGVVLVYVLRSGVLGVGWTNTFQGLFMMVLAWAIGLYLPRALHGGIGPMFERIAAERPELLRPPGLDPGGAPWTWGEYSSAILVSAAGFSIWPHLFMKAFTARSERVLRRTVVLYPTFQLFVVPLLVLGFTGVLFRSSPESPDQILPHMLMSMDGMPSVVVGLFCAGALAASMSSGDAMVHACSSILVRDGWITTFRRRVSPERERFAIRVLVVVVMLAAYGVAFVYEGSLVRLLLFAYGPIVQFAPAVVACLYLRRATGVAVLLGLVAGIAVNLLLVLEPSWRPYPLHAGSYGLLANVLVFLMVSFLHRPADTTEDERFLTLARGSSDTESGNPVSSRVPSDSALP